MQQCNTGNNAQPTHNSPGQTEIMAKFLQLAIWNANGLAQNKEELKIFLSIYDIDVILISETHFTEKKISREYHTT
jgi:hypothetical protein